MSAVKDCGLRWNATREHGSDWELRRQTVILDPLRFYFSALFLGIRVRFVFFPSSSCPVLSSFEKDPNAKVHITYPTC